MPSSPNYVRDYKQEHKTAVQRGDYANKLIRGKARRLMIKKGLVKKGQDVDHKKPLSKILNVFFRPVVMAHSIRFSMACSLLINRICLHLLFFSSDQEMILRGHAD